MEELLLHKEEINRQMARYGVKFGIYKNGIFKERLFPFDPIPRVISHEDYQQTMHYISELEERLALYAHLAQSMDDIKLGRVHSADDVFNDLISDLENLDV